MVRFAATAAPAGSTGDAGTGRGIDVPIARPEHDRQEHKPQQREAERQKATRW